MQLQHLAVQFHLRRVDSTRSGESLQVVRPSQHVLHGVDTTGAISKTRWEATDGDLCDRGSHVQQEQRDRVTATVWSAVCVRAQCWDAGADIQHLILRPSAC